MIINLQTVLISILGVISLTGVILNYLQMVENNSIKKDIRFAVLQQEREFEREQEIKGREARIKSCINEKERKTQTLQECNRDSLASDRQMNDVKNLDVASGEPQKELQNIIMTEQEKTDDCFYRRKELGMELAVCNGEQTRLDKENVFRDQNFLDRIKSFVMFIGYARSGHSIVGSLLDAHPHIAISHELNIVKIWETSYRNGSKTRIDLFGEILDNTIDTISDEKGFRSPKLTRKYYTLDVPCLYQGKYEDYLQIIGDKKGDSLISFMKKNKEGGFEGFMIPEFKKIEKFIGYSLKILHIVRNPYDNIATKYLYGMSQQLRKEAAMNETIILRDLTKLKKYTENHLKCYKPVPDFMNYFGERMLTLQHEDLIENPQLFLTRICNFFEIYCPREYLKRASKVVFSSPTKSRHSVEWNQEIKKTVETAIQKYDFLQGYSFDS